MSEHWIDVMSGVLGRLQYKHIHVDLNEYPARIEGGERGWVSTPGVVPETVTITCTNCGKVMAPGDEIHVQSSSDPRRII